MPSVMLDDVPEFCGVLRKNTAWPSTADAKPGIYSDIPAMRERAERVKARARHKDLDGETARLLACDVLSLIEAMEEMG
jgi:hypothetical protein